jgi:hypothetical protein
MPIKLPNTKSRKKNIKSASTKNQQTIVTPKQKVLNSLKQSIIKLQIHPLRLKQAIKLTFQNKNKTSSQLAQIFSQELNLPYLKASQLAELLLNRQKIKKTKQ